LATLILGPKEMPFVIFHKGHFVLKFFTKTAASDVRHSYASPELQTTRVNETLPWVYFNNDSNNDLEKKLLKTPMIRTVSNRFKKITAKYYRNIERLFRAFR
jgi:hypothetical protein